MPYEEKIKNFRSWATNLGCPPGALPSEDALRSIFKSRQGELFMQLQERIHSVQHAREVRENLLIAQIARHKGKLVPACTRSLLPREMQTHLAMQDLQQEKEKADYNLAEAKKENDALASAIKTKNIQIISAKHKKQLLQSECNVLELKLESLNKAYSMELETKAQILATMPVKLNHKNSSEKQAAKAVEQALKELENFYSICNSEGTNGHQLMEAKPLLWAKMRQIFANTPNLLIFNAIMKLKVEQLQHIMELNKLTTNSATNSTTTDGSGSSIAAAKQPLDNFEVKLLKTKADLMGIVANYVTTQNQVVQLESRFSAGYELFVNELQKKVNTFNGISIGADDAESSEEIIFDFLLQYNMRNFYRYHNDFLAEQIEQLRQELEMGAKQLESHEMLLVSIKQKYEEINTSINRIQHDMLQLSQIKEKILYSKNMLKNQLDYLNQQTRSHLVSTKLKGNMSLLGVESFCLANDSVFSSTRLDIDANASAMNCTLRRSFENLTLMPVATTTTNPTTGPITVPCHLLELNAFVDMALEKLSCIPRASLFCLSANPLIVETQELASTVQLAPGHLLTPSGALQEVRKRILWASAIAAHSSDLKLNLEPLIVDPHSLKLKARRQHEEVAQLLDNIDALGAKTQLQLHKIRRIYRFILDNPLRQYVPPKRTFNNASYADYETEFNLYYRIAISGGSIRS